MKNVGKSGIVGRQATSNTNNIPLPVMEKNKNNSFTARERKESDRYIPIPEMETIRPKKRIQKRDTQMMLNTQKSSKNSIMFDGLRK